MKQNSFKTKSNTFFGMFSLIGKSFFRNARGPLFMYIVPTFFTVLFYFIFQGQQGNADDKSFVLGYLMLPALTVMTSLSAAIVEWKNSVFLKRIDTTGITKTQFIGSLWLFYFATGLSGIVWEIILCLIIGQGDVVEVYKNVNWGYLLLGSILVLFTSIGIATILGGTIKSDGLVQGVTMMVYFFSIFLSGVMLPPQSYEMSNGHEILGMRIFSYFVPLKYSVALVLFANAGSAGWDAGFNTGTYAPDATPLFHDFTAVWQPLVGSIAIIALLFVLSTWLFKWNGSKR